MRKLIVGKKYILENQRTGTPKLVEMIDPNVRGGGTHYAKVRILDNDQVVAITVDSIYEYRWFDEYKPHVIGFISSVAASIFTAWAVVSLSLN